MCFPLGECYYAVAEEAWALHDQISFNLHRHWEDKHSFPYFIDKKPEVQKCHVTCLGVVLSKFCLWILGFFVSKVRMIILTSQSCE